jgi:uncharacterized protein (DUF1778 family)
MPKRVTKGEHINIRCSLAQKVELTKAAIRTGMSTSAWMLSLSLAEARKINAET